MTDTKNVTEKMIENSNETSTFGGFITQPISPEIYSREDIRSLTSLHSVILNILHLGLLQADTSASNALLNQAINKVIESHSMVITALSLCNEIILVPDLEDKNQNHED